MSEQVVSAAPPGGGITWSDYKGALLLIAPLSLEVGVKTTFGESDAVKADVYVLDGEHEGDENLGTLIFPKLLVSQTSRNIGSKVVGRLSQGVAKASQSAPWLLTEATAADLTVAQAWLAARSTPALASAKPPF